MTEMDEVIQFPIISAGISRRVQIEAILELFYTIQLDENSAFWGGFEKVLHLRDQLW